MTQFSIRSKVKEFQKKVRSAKLLVVTKKRSVREIREVIASGVKYIGENTLQEIQKKYDHPLMLELQKNGVELHYIGHLQTNKIRKIVRFCDVIHSLDSLEKAEKVNQAAAELNKVMPIFIELNLTGEEQKHGINLPSVEEPSGEDIPARPAGGDPRLRGMYVRLQELISMIPKLPNLKLLGFMCIGKHDDPEETRKVFRRCKQLADQCQLPETSMGMSNDYQIALEEGTTMVRLGNAVFE